MFKHVLRHSRQSEGGRGEKRKSRRQEEVEGGGREVTEGLLGFVESGDADLRVNKAHEHFDLHVIKGSMISMEIGQTRRAEKAGTLIYV